MTTLTTPRSIRWHVLREAQGRLDALVVVLVRRQDLPFATSLVEAWGEGVPHCHFLAGRADVHAGGMPARHLGTSLWSKVRKLGVQPAQTILIGVGEAARWAFDMVVLGGLAGLGAILVDMVPVLAPPIAPVVGAALRFVRHSLADGAEDPARRDFDAMLQGLRQASIDLRSMTLPKGPDAASRAVGAYLIELVARASWHRNLPKTSLLPVFPSSPESQS